MGLLSSLFGKSEEQQQVETLSSKYKNTLNILAEIHYQRIEVSGEELTDEDEEKMAATVRDLYNYLESVEYRIRLKFVHDVLKFAPYENYDFNKVFENMKKYVYQHLVNTGKIEQKDDFKAYLGDQVGEIIETLIDLKNNYNKMMEQNLKDDASIKKLAKIKRHIDYMLNQYDFYEKLRYDIVNKDGRGSYNGATSDGKRHGFGKFDYTSGDTYSGEWTNGKRHGNGIMSFADGREYEGQWVNDRIHGNGAFYNKAGELKYQGNWVNGKPE